MEEHQWAKIVLMQSEQRSTRFAPTRKCQTIEKPTRLSLFTRRWLKRNEEKGGLRKKMTTALRKVAPRDLGKMGQGWGTWLGFKFIETKKGKSVAKKKKKKKPGY